MQAVLSALRQALGPDFNPFGGGRAGRGGQAPLVEAGDYKVTVTAGGRTMTERLRVEIVTATGSN
jgi:hypothetical protein